MPVSAKPFEPDAACPLDGVRVVDMSRLVAGNAVTSQLADFGAEIIKIEDPGKGDPLRAWQTDGVSVHWKLYSRNKKSVALSPRDKRGLSLLRDLIVGADVLVENFRPGTLEKMGLAPAALHAQNPRLVIVRVSGWGQDGPYKDRPGFGTLVESMSGYASRTGFADREPVLPPTALADMVAGLYGAFATMVALRRVEVEGGNGQVIDLPLLDPLFSFIATEAPIFNLTKAIRPRTGSRSETTSPRNVFRTKDGRYIGISASIQAMSERLFRAIGREDMITDPRFHNNTVRVKNADQTEAPIVEFIGSRTLEENMKLFEAAEVTASPVYDIDQFLADPHVQARDIVVDMPDRQVGSITMHNVIPRLSDTPGRLRTPAPEIGEHTAEILGQLGVDEATLAVLAKDGVIGLGQQE
ncbi:MAG TPA: CoA transferase [Stellaceae bacterium]|jgi:crotonobetainyl-CoA:carnitine CoA-transferase CaiB-like acyl-CoA transferase|nr:CoA transferase [Stellaceae bacterium]